MARKSAQRLYILHSPRAVVGATPGMWQADRPISQVTCDFVRCGRDGDGCASSRGW